MYLQITLLSILLTIGLLMRLTDQSRKTRPNEESFTQTVDFSNKLTENDRYEPPPPESTGDELTPPVPSGTNQRPTFIYRDNNQFDHVYVDHISKKNRTRHKLGIAPIRFHADVNVHGNINTKELTLDGAPFVSYNNLTNTIEFQ